jgi:hypothetical protein
MVSAIKIIGLPWLSRKAQFNRYRDQNPTSWSKVWTYGPHLLTVYETLNVPSETLKIKLSPDLRESFSVVV